MESVDRNSTCSEDIESVGTNYDNMSRTSSSFDEQSSGDSDNDEPDIDQMLSELEGFQVELIAPYGQEEESPENNEPLDEISFSMNAIEDSGDVDLDALLEDLCSMERDLLSSVAEEATARSPSKNSARRLSSPIKVTADVKWKLGALEEELENQKELTFEQQQAKFKEEKIRIAMEKLREARIKKLVIKVFNDEDPTSKTILVDQTWTAWDVCKKMMIKYDQEASTNWLLEERQPANQIDRVLEDHECIVDIVSQWPRETTNQIVFSLRRDKYILFKNPQTYLLSSDTGEGSTRLAEQSKDTLISEFFKPDAMRLPNLDGVLYLKEGKKSWKKHYFLLRASGVYYTPKGKTKNQRNLSCLVSLDQTYVYTTNDFKKNQKAPTEHCFVIKPSIAKDLESRQVKCLCAPDNQTMQRWVTCIRVGKFGYKMLENKNTAFEEVEDLTVGDVKRPRTMSSSSSSSSEFGQQEIASRVRNRSDATEYNTYKKSQNLKAQPEKGAKAKTIGKLFQDAWKKGGSSDQGGVTSPVSPQTPFSPPRSVQTPTSGPKSFFVENEKLRNLDNIKEENSGPPVKHGLTLVLDPAPSPRKSFSDQGDQNPTTQETDLPLSSPPPAVLPKHVFPSPDLPPPPPPVSPKVIQASSNQISRDDVIGNTLVTSDSYDSLSLPPTPDRPDTPNSCDEIPLPPPPLSSPPVSPKPNSCSPKKEPPQILFPPPPAIPITSDKLSAPPPPAPPPPPPLPGQATKM